MNLAITPMQAAAFLLASYAVLGNDALQTLGPFLAANRGRIARPWQALFLCAVLVAVLGLGWLAGAGQSAGVAAAFAGGLWPRPGAGVGHLCAGCWRQPGPWQGGSGWDGSG